MYQFPSNSNSISPNDSPIIDSLKSYSNDELQKLLDDDNQIINLINSNQKIQQMKQRRDQLLIDNKKLASENKSFEPELFNSKSKLIEEYQKLRNLKSINEDLRTRIESYSEKYSPNSMLTLLMAGMAESEEQSEKCAEQFMVRAIDVEKFIESFVEKRNLYHERRIKVDQLQDLISNQPRVTAASSTGSGGAPTLPQMAPPPCMSNYSNFPAYFPGSQAASGRPDIGFKY